MLDAYEIKNALTRCDASPPRWISQVSKAISVKAMLLHGCIEALFRNDKTRAFRPISTGVSQISCFWHVPIASDELTASIRPTYLSTASARSPLSPSRSCNVLVFHHVCYLKPFRPCFADCRNSRESFAVVRVVCQARSRLRCGAM